MLSSASLNSGGRVEYVAIDFAEKLAKFSEYWSPQKVIACHTVNLS